MLTKTQYLYGFGVDPSLWPHMQYPDVLRSKIKQAQNTIRELQDSHYLERDSVRINKCFDAIAFNEVLLKEMK